MNLPDNWKEDPEVWAYSRGFVLDGNFSCNHKAQRRPETDVWLKNGEGYMVERERYAKHLVTAMETKEVSSILLMKPEAGENNVIGAYL